jgi:hypothetical protein
MVALFWFAFSHDHRLEIVDEIERQRVDRAVDHMGAEMPHADGVAVRCGARRARHADGAARAGYVFDQDRLAERLAHAFADGARQRIGRPTSGERHVDGDRLRWERLRLRDGNSAEQHQCSNSQVSFHCQPLPTILI